MMTFASSVALSDSNSAPYSPPFNKFRKAGISLATIAVSDARASVKIIPNDSPPVFGATYKSIDLRKLPFSASLIRPKNDNLLRSWELVDFNISALSPGPAIKTFTSGTNLEIIGNASIRICRPFRGSSKRPIKPMVLPFCHSTLGSDLAKKSTSIPFGITIASVSK